MSGDWSWIELELSAYRRGFISVRLDFTRRVLIWKDSNRWFNNFVRALTAERLKTVEEEMNLLLEQSTAPDPTAGPEHPAALAADPSQRPGHEAFCPSEKQDYVWYLLVGQEGEEGHLLRQAYGLENAPWQRFANILGQASQRPFRF